MMDFIQAQARGVPASHDIANDNGGPDPQVLSLSELVYLRRGLTQPGGKLPLFDLDGKPVAARIVRACVARGLAEPWFNNPLKPDWLVCRLTANGRYVAETARPADA